MEYFISFPGIFVDIPSLHIFIEFLQIFIQFDKLFLSQDMNVTVSHGLPPSQGKNVHFLTLGIESDILALT